jgi:hypothetical protein
MFPTPRLPTGIMRTVYRIDKAAGYRDYDNGGKWVDGAEVKISFQGSIYPLSEDDIKYDQGGTYKETDRKLYTNTKCGIGQEIEFDNARYTVQREQDHGITVGLYRYIIRRVGGTVD